MKTALWKPGINFLCTHPGSPLPRLFPGFCLPACLPGYIFPQMMRRWTQDPIQKQPGVRGPFGGGNWGTLTPGHHVPLSPALVIFLISTESAGSLCGNIKCYHGCHSCAPLFPVAEPRRDLPGDCAKCGGGLDINPCHRWSRLPAKPEFYWSLPSWRKKQTSSPRQAPFWDGEPGPPNARPGPLEALCLALTVSHPAVSVS